MANAQQSPMTEGLNKQFVEAFKTRDFAALAGMFTEDAVMLPPRRDMITGKRNIQSFWTQARRIRQVRFDSDSVATLGGDVIREIGTFRMLLERGGSRRGDEEASEDDIAGGADRTTASREIVGKYVFLWRKIKGEWKLETSMWNRNQAEQGGAQRRRRRRRARE
jgi:ketosteroid isomerase-like protein